MTIAFTALSDSRFWSRHVLLSGPKLQNTNCTDTFSTAVTRRKQQASGRLRTANNIIVKCFFSNSRPWKVFHFINHVQVLMVQHWWYAAHRQQKPPSSPQQRIFNTYSSSPNGLWVNSPWGRRPNGLLTQAMRARGIIVLVKSNELVKSMENKKLLAS